MALYGLLLMVDVNKHVAIEINRQLSWINQTNRPEDKDMNYCKTELLIPGLGTGFILD